MAQFLLVAGIEIILGLVIGFIAGLIWKDNRPIGVQGDFLVAIGACLVFGLGEWYLLPMLGFSQTIKLLGVFGEAPAIALIILWMIRYTRRNK
jgi:uncharacterized membrane protein YeaQ/YmgE (transglycosylase-associated protein family)